MKRIGMSGLAGLMLVLCLGAPAGAYTLELIYGPNANVADPSATFWTVAPADPVSGLGLVSKSVTTIDLSPPPSATGATTVRPAVVLTADHVDNNQSIINTAATAYWYGYGQGFGSSNMGFIIHPGTGEATQVMATLGFRVSGTVNLQSAANNNYLILDYVSSLIKPDLTELTIASDNQTWSYAIYASTLYSSGGEVTVTLNANELYVFKSHLQVDASVWGNDPENSINFDGFVTIQDIQAVPLPPGIVLLGSGLIGLGISALRRRG